MEVHKPVLELKDVPPPPLHSAAQQPLVLAPQPVSPPCQLPASDPQLPQQTLTHLQPGSSKVSLCSRCECDLHVQHHPDSLEARVHGFGDSLGGVGSIRNNANAGTGGGFPAPFSPTELQTPQSFGFRVASVATSQPMAAHTHPSCCGHLHTCSSVSVGCLQSKHVSGAAPVHGPCVALSGCCRCSEEHRVEQHYHSHGDAPSSTHLCTNPLYLEHNTVCQTGAHYCHQCLRKVGFFASSTTLHILKVGLSLVQS